MTHNLRNFQQIHLPTTGSLRRRSDRKAEAARIRQAKALAKSWLRRAKNPDLFVPIEIKLK